MRVAIDVDGVLAEQVRPILQQLQEQNSVEMEKSDIKTWDEPIEKIDSDIKIEIEKRFNSPGFVSDLPLIPGAKEGVEKLRKRGHEIIIATNRPNEISTETEKWLLDNDIQYDEFTISSNWDKSELDADVLIDDYPGHIKNFVESTGFGILFIQPWNKSMVKEPIFDTAKAEFAEDWLELIDIVENLEGRGDEIPQGHL